MFEALTIVYVLGIVVFLFGGLLSGKDNQESTLQHVLTSVGVAIFWLPGLILLVGFFIYWGIVGD